MGLLWLFAGLALFLGVPCIIGLYFGGRSLRNLLVQEQQRRGGGSEPPPLALLVTRTTNRIFLAVPFSSAAMVLYLIVWVATKQDGIARSTYFTTAMGVLGLAMLFTGVTILQFLHKANADRIKEHDEAGRRKLGSSRRRASLDGSVTSSMGSMGSLELDEIEGGDQSNSTRKATISVSALGSAALGAPFAMFKSARTKSGNQQGGKSVMNPAVVNLA